MSTSTPCWRSWRTFFDARAERPVPLIEADPDLGLSPAARAELIRSLAIFQMGESSGGRIATQIDRCRVAGIDDDYRHALRRFIAEEHRHGEILERLIHSVGGETLRHNWTESLFRHGRRLIGVRLKILVLLCAEVIGLCFYGALVRRLPRGTARQMLRHISADEAHHLDFHCDFFRTQTQTRLGRAVFGLSWWVVVTAAFLAVLVDHRATLRQLQISPSKLARTCLALSRRAHARVIRPRVRLEQAA